MKSIKIVFTGGPCAGKTILINRTKEYLKSKNYNVIIVPETATKLIEMGFNNNLVPYVLDFQKLVFKKQLLNEMLVEKVNTDRQLIILYDRGILDNKAYCNGYKNFDKIINTQKNQN